MAFQWACKVKEALSFQLTPDSSTVTDLTTEIQDKNLDLSNIPKEYWQFSDIFCKQKAKSLLNHQPYNLSIQIEEGSSLPLRPIYSLSVVELQTLWEFIDKNTKSGIIRPSNLPCGSPVLFIRKKNRSLQLCYESPKKGIVSQAFEHLI